MTRSHRTVIFWGAGATASLGMQMTSQQTKTLRTLADVQEEQKSLAQRIEVALKCKAEKSWTSALGDLLTILGDDGKGGTSEEDPIVTVTPHQIDAMRRNWPHGANDDELRKRIVTLRTLYDWPALRAIVNVCPGVQGNSFQLNDLFNVLDMHGQSGHGFRVKEGEFLTPQRVLGARNALKMLLQGMFYIDWQYGRVKNREILGTYIGKLTNSFRQFFNFRLPFAQPQPK